jgi:hypothetical protein
MKIGKTVAATLLILCRPRLSMLRKLQATFR